MEALQQIVISLTAIVLSLSAQVGNLVQANHNSQTALVPPTSLSVPVGVPDSIVCPMIYSTSPNFCLGGVISSGGTDKNGCTMPPICSMPTSTSTPVACPMFANPPSWCSNGRIFTPQGLNANGCPMEPTCIIPTSTSTPVNYTEYIKSTLRLGSMGSQVSFLQKVLVKESLLPADSITSYFGRVTETALRAFQTRYGIVSSGTPWTTGYGVTGPTTRAKLNEILNK